MNREDIIRMARQAGSLIEIAQEKDLLWLEAFAALVASAEREAWEHRYARLQSLMDVRETQPNKPCCLAEREACAKVCESLPLEWPDQPTFAQTERATMMDCAAAIRARGQA